MNRYTVSTECPNCGAPLDFDEGVNSIRCGHCRSNLLVTGRRQLLSYFVSPRIPEKEAALSALQAYQSQGFVLSRAIDRQIYFLPYYRFTGHDLRWEETQLRMPDAPAGIERDYGISVDSDGSRVTLCAPEDFAGLTISTINLNDRHVERSFSAVPLDGHCVYSLGIRPQAERLELFRRPAVEALGKIVPPEISADDAQAIGLKGPDREMTLIRIVMNQVLSLIYYPFWLIEVIVRGEQRFALVDGVSKAVIKLDLPAAFRQRLETAGPLPEQKIVGFRPLICPNCGWDLPLQPEAVIFFCSGCSKAWQITGSDLREMAYEIGIPRGSGFLSGQRCLPFWMVRQRTTGEDQRLYLPAFGYRGLKVLTDLASAITRKQPDFEYLEGERPRVEGCAYDEEDAMKMALFVSARMQARLPDEMRRLDTARFEFSNASLIGFPFESRGVSLFDHFTGLNLLQELIL